MDPFNTIPSVILRCIGLLYIYIYISLTVTKISATPPPVSLSSPLPNYTQVFTNTLKFLKHYIHKKILRFFCATLGWAVVKTGSRTAAFPPSLDIRRILTVESSSQFVSRFHTNKSHLENREAGTDPLRMVCESAAIAGKILLCFWNVLNLMNCHSYTFVFVCVFFPVNHCDTSRPSTSLFNTGNYILACRSKNISCPQYVRIVLWMFNANTQEPQHRNRWSQCLLRLLSLFLFLARRLSHITF